MRTSGETQANSFDVYQRHVSSNRTNFDRDARRVRLVGTIVRTENRLLILFALFAPFAEVFPYFDATTAVGDLLEVFVVTVVVTIVVIRRFRLDHILRF